MAEAYLGTDFYRRYRRYYTYIEPVVSDPLVRSYFGLVLSLFLSAFFLVFALSPTVATILGLVKKIDDQKMAIAAMDKKTSDLIMAQANYSQAESSLPLLTGAIPPKPHPQTIIAGVLSAASSSGATVGSFQFTDITLSPKTNEIPSIPELSGGATSGPSLGNVGLPAVTFTLGVSSDTQHSLDDFLRNLESLSRIMTITYLSISQSGGPSGAAPSYGANIKILAWYYL